MSEAQTNASEEEEEEYGEGQIRALEGVEGIRTRPAMYIGDRSEERRVGKEGRSRWSPYH